jgi:glycosyltransferase involved in cell wall biosynthesis
VNGVRELIGADEAGILAGRDAEQVSRALITLAADSELRARMGSVGRRRAAAFDQQAVAGRVADLHESLLDSASTR